VKIGAERDPVTRSRAKCLRQVAFEFDGNAIMGIEQNPKTKSRWAQLARAEKKVMQFTQDGRYVAVVADGKVILYRKRDRVRAVMGPALPVAEESRLCVT
jgi:hypothetical protein